MREEVVSLDAWDKLAILAGVALFMALVIFCLICSLSPFCWLNKYCPFKYNDKQKQDNKPLMKYGATDRSIDSKRKKKSRVGSLKEFESSDWSDSSALSAIELQKTYISSNSVPNGNLRLEASGTHLQDGTLHFSLKYDQFERQLLINVLHVENFAVEGESAVLSPYVRIRLYKTQKLLFSGGINSLDKEFRTRLQKYSEVPTFNESFKATIDPTELMFYSIKFQLCDLDRFSRKVVIGECTVKLKKLNLEDFTESQCQEKLQLPVQEEAGEIYVGLNYLPTAEKLYVTVSKMKIHKTKHRQNNIIDSYVKISLMRDGRPLKKSKTAVKTEDANPDFDETFAFDVPRQELDNVYIAISAVCSDQNEHKLLGRTYVGLHFESAANAHWTDMLRSPRNQSLYWHKILE